MSGVAKKILLSIVLSIPSIVIGIILREALQKSGILDPLSDWLGGWLKMHVSPTQAYWATVSIITLVTYAALLWGVWRPHRIPLSGKDSTAARPDMTISDAIDYIANDSNTQFAKPKRPTAPSDFPPWTRMLVVGALHMQAQRQLSDKINSGDVRSWGLRQIDTHVRNKFESSLREIPASYWNDMQLDFHSARFYRSPYSQTMAITGRSATYKLADIMVSRAQIEAFWPKKFIAARLYNKMLKRRVLYGSEFQL
jgi:hypothetical protein